MRAESSSQHHPKCRRRRRVRRDQAETAQVVIGLLILNAAVAVHAQAPSARWGQASAVIGDTLYIQGGKVDPSNSYSYTSAPNTNDLYALDLSIPFQTSDPPWTYLSGSNNQSTPQGPSVAFHTLTPYSANQFLAFGGDGGPSLPIQTNNDSAWTFDICHGCEIIWTQEALGWDSEPMRRMYQSAATTGSEVWITGGQKADGSGLGFSQTYTFDGSAFSAFDPIGTSIPPDLVGHRSVVLPSGLLVVLGGYSPSQATLSSLSTLYFLDTKASNPAWGNITVLGQTPSPRRNFALALMEGNKLLVHGGGDGPLENLYSDGAILDMNLSPISWITAPNLAAGLGARVDHVAAGVGSSVLFGLGRAANGPAPADLLLYDATTGSFGTSFAPSSGGNGGSNGDGGGNGNGGSNGNGGGATVLPTGTQGYTTGVDWPTTYVTGLIPGQSSTNSVSLPTQTSGGGGQSQGDGASGNKQQHVAAIAVGSVLGILGSLALGIALVYWCLRRRSRGLLLRVPLDRHRLIQGSGDTQDPELTGGLPREKIPVAGGEWTDEPRRMFFGILPMPFGRSSSSRERFDMLHDEDARSFRRGPSQTSTAGAGAVRPSFRRMGSSSRNIWDGVWNASTHSFKVAGAALGLASGANTPNVDKSSPDWWEKRKDPFADDAVALADVPSVTAVGMGLANRQRGGHQASSSYGSSFTYRDPFRDNSLGAHSKASTSASGNMYGDVPAAEPWQPFVLPMAGELLTRSGYASPPLSPIMEPGPQLGVGIASGSGGSRTSSDLAHQITPASDVTHYSLSSGDKELSSPSSLHPPLSLIGSAPTTPMKRSDSWWNRFGRTSLGSRSPGTDRLSPIRRLSLRNSFTGSKEGYTNLDFRDPNPPPRLAGIEETGKSNDPSPATPESRKGKTLPPSALDNKKPSHSKSMSSFETADSAALEKMGGRVDVVQRRQGSSESSPGTSLYEEWEIGHGRLVSMNHMASPDGSVATDRPSLHEKTSSSTNTTGHGQSLHASSLSPPITSPMSGTQETYTTAFTHHTTRPSPITTHNSDESYKSALSSIPPPPKAPPKRRVTSGVAARVALYDNIAEAGGSVASLLPKSPKSPTFPTFPTSPPRSPRTSSEVPLTLTSVVNPVIAGPLSASPAPIKSPELPDVTEKRRSKGNVRYGLTERPSLFVANPDRSGDSNTSP